MRPMAWVAIAEAALIAYLVFKVVRGDRRADGRVREVQRLAVAQANLADGRADVVIMALRDELHRALDRIQMPEAAVADSQADRAMRVPQRASGPVPILSEEREPSLGDAERAQAREYLKVELEQVEKELEARGVHPSELSPETGASSVG